MLFRKHRGQQDAVAKRIDPPRNARRKRIDRVKRPGLEPRVVAPAYMPQPMFDVRLSFGAIHRTQVIRRGYALPQLLQLRPLHELAQLRLADQETLQEPLVAELEIGQHAELLNRPAGEILRLVDNQQRALALRHERDQERFELGQQLRLVHRPG